MRFLKFMFIGMILGIVIGAGMPIASTLLSPWDFIGKVPGTPTQIINSYPVHVQTSDEQVYFCHSSTNECVLVENYLPQPLQSRGYPDLCAARGMANSQTPLYPGNVIVSAVSGICGPESSIYDYTIALDDGSVWIWQDRGTGLTTIFYGIFGAFVGAVIGILLHRFSQPTQGKAKRA